MKINWGFGIGLFYTFFAVALVYLVVKSTSYDHSLVVDNYYEEDLKYQEHYDKLANSNALEKDLLIQHDLDRKSIRLQFPDDVGNIDGTISFYRPSDSSRDLKQQIKVNQNFEQILPVSELQAGKWKIKVDWKAGGKPYFKEETIVL